VEAGWLVDGMLLEDRPSEVVGRAAEVEGWFEDGFPEDLSDVVGRAEELGGGFDEVCWVVVTGLSELGGAAEEDG
jgi:hypothetical protein